MANWQHVQLLRATVGGWNVAREGDAGRHPDLPKLDLREPDLRGADLSEKDLRSVNLRKAKLQGANLREADLLGADLRDADLTEANLRGVDLRKAKLSWANLCRATLEGANLKGADLNDVKLGGARLDIANFCRANLVNAVFVEESGSDIKGEANEHHIKNDGSISSSKHPEATVSGAKFGMAKLTGAILPESLGEFETALKNVEETSKSARIIFLQLIGLCAFSLLTVSTATDAQLVLNNLRLKLPVLGVEVPVGHFYIGAPILGLLIFIYLHMYLSHLWELISRLPTYFPDGLPLRQKLYPWMMNLIVEDWQRENSSSEETGQSRRERIKGWVTTRFSLRNLRGTVTVYLGWGLLPSTIGIIAYRFLVRRDVLFSLLLLGLLTLSVMLALAFYQRARVAVRTVRNTDEKDKWRQKIADGDEKDKWRWEIVVVLAAGILTFYSGWLVLDQGIAGNLPWTGRKIQLRGVNLEDKVIGGVDLTGADLSFAKLMKADLRQAKLIDTNLRGANLSRADLSQATLQGADFQEADLRRIQRVHLVKAKLHTANSSIVDQLCQAATLWRAQLDPDLKRQVNKQCPRLLKKPKVQEEIASSNSR